MSYDVPCALRCRCLSMNMLCRYLHHIVVLRFSFTGKESFYAHECNLLMGSSGRCQQSVAHISSTKMSFHTCFAVSDFEERA